jgi:hypothetical protein
MTQPGERKASHTWPEITAVVFSIVAIVISGYSLLEGRWQHQDERNVEVLDAVYEDWMALAMRDDWRVQHVQEAPDTYYAVRDVARRLTAGMSDTEKAETFLMERAMANLIFTNFEHHLKQWLLAIELDDESRQRVLKEEIDFYAEVLMRNPRLLWYWSPEGGGWIRGADPSTIKWLEERALADPERPLTTRMDPEGILPGFDWRGSGVEQAATTDGAH